MAITFPISLPSGGIVSARARHINNISMSRSVFTAETQKQRFQGERFEYDLTVKPQRYADAGAWRAALASLSGLYGTCLYGDPDFLARGPVGANLGTPVVDGASQPIASETLDTKGWTPMTSRVLARGDFFQIGSGSTARLHMVLADADSDSSGFATLDIWPRLRFSPADEAAIVVTGAKGVFELTSRFTEYSSDQNSVFAFAFTLGEAL